MKTSMQEHFEWLQENQLYFGIPIEAIDNAEDLLEKEKEQIKKANLDGYKEGCTYHSFDHRPITSEEYYNQTYNQKEI